MSERPFVSVIMPVYNAAPFLQESLGSLVRQSLQNIEIICVNDGSTDESLLILQEYAEEDPRIRIIDKSNGGYGHAMNRGLAAASGEYIGILEPDDFADPEMYESLYQTALKMNADIVKSEYWEYRGSDGSSTFHTQVNDPEYPFPGKEYNVCYNANDDPRLVIIPPCIWSAIYRKRMLDENRIVFNETPGASYQDTSFSFKVLACAERVVFIKEAFIHYRMDNENSSVKSQAKVFSICDEFSAIEAFINEKKERRELFGGVLYVHKLRIYEWNYFRIVPEYKRTFAMYMGIEFLKAQYEGFLSDKYFSKEQLGRAKWWIDQYNYYVNAEDKISNSPSYRIGRMITYVPRKIRDLLPE